ncbi:MAG: alpha/beta hydrolase [Patescibacteria group bacterium]|jgi:hypothetical protein
MKVVLIHGKDTDPSKKWYPWLREEMEKRGSIFLAPILPNSSDPVLADWLTEIDDTKPDSKTIIIGHSRGGVAVLRWLENQPASVKVLRVILVSTNSGRTEDKAISGESNYGFYTEAGYNFNKIKSHCDDFVVFHSKDDVWVPFSAGEMNSVGLSAKFIQFDNYGHFGSGVSSIPELLSEILR